MYSQETEMEMRVVWDCMREERGLIRTAARVFEFERRESIGKARVFVNSKNRSP